MLSPKAVFTVHKIRWLPIIILILSGCSTDLSLLSDPNSSAISTSASPSAALLPGPPSIVDEQAMLIDLYERVNPSVVNITVFGQQGREVSEQSQGSGFVYDEAGHIITNAHVVAGANQVEVTFSNGIIHAAEIVGQDSNSDLAVLKVEQLPAGAGPLPLDDLSDLAVGQTVVAIGNPFGLEGTLTRGIISALGRTIPTITSYSIPQAIQTDAAINPGNSGGPLLDLRGRVIGVNAQGIGTDGPGGGNSGLNFAIPANIVRRVVPALINDGRYEWAWLGAGGDSVTPTLVEALNLPVKSGAYIAQIAPGGPADQAGLRGTTQRVLVNGRSVEVGGDVVTAINGQLIHTSEDLLAYVSLQAGPGQEVTLTVVREGQTHEVRVRLGTRPVTFQRP